MLDFNELQALASASDQASKVMEEMVASDAGYEKTPSPLGDDDIWWKPTPNYDKNISQSRVRIMPQSATDLKLIKDGLADESKKGVNRLLVSYWESYIKPNASVGIEKGTRFTQFSPSMIGRGRDPIESFLWEIRTKRFGKKPDQRIKDTPEYKGWMARFKSMSQFFVVPVLILEDMEKPENVGKVKLWKINHSKNTDDQGNSKSFMENWLFNDALKTETKFGKPRTAYDVLAWDKDSTRGKSCNIAMQIDYEQSSLKNADGQPAKTKDGKIALSPKYDSRETEMTLEASTLAEDVIKYLGCAKKDVNAKISELWNSTPGMLHWLDAANYPTNDEILDAYCAAYNLDKETGMPKMNNSLIGSMPTQAQTPVPMQQAAPAIQTTPSMSMDDSELADVLSQLGIKT